MNGSWIMAAALAALTTFVHLQFGGEDVIVPLLQGSVDEVAKITLHAVWHMVSVVLGSSALALLMAGFEGGASRLSLMRWLAWQHALFGALCVGLGAQRFGWLGVWLLPQWVLLWPIALLIWWGIRRETPAIATRALIDRVMPAWDFNERHSILVSASREQVERALDEVDLARSSVVRLLFKLRRLPTHDLRLRGMLSFLQMRTLSRPGEQCHFSCLRPSGQAVPFEQGTFATMRARHALKLAWSFSAVELGDGTTLLSTETRVQSSDRLTHLLFALYWAVVRPFSGAIRMILLRAVKAGAERCQQPVHSVAQVSGSTSAKSASV